MPKPWLIMAFHAKQHLIRASNILIDMLRERSLRVRGSEGRDQPAQDVVRLSIYGLQMTCSPREGLIYMIFDRQTGFMLCSPHEPSFGDRAVSEHHSSPGIYP
jgi:hypothetical protein